MDDYVYLAYNDGGKDKYYHHFPDCPRLDRSTGIISGTAEDVERVKGLSECLVCRERLSKEAKPERTPKKFVSKFALSQREKSLVYWRADIKDEYFHTERNCPNILFASMVGQGTREEAAACGHTVLCNECILIGEDKKIEEEARVKSNKMAETKQKEEFAEALKKGKIEAAFLGVFFTFLIFAFFFSSYMDDQLEQSKQEKYEIGYEDGKEKGYDEGYYAGREAGFSEGEEEGYYYGYDTGYKDGQEMQSYGESYGTYYYD